MRRAALVAGVGIILAASVGRAQPTLTFQIVGYNPTGNGCFFFSPALMFQGNIYTCSNGTTYSLISGGSGTPGGSNGQTQYNNVGAFGGYTPSGDLTVNTSNGVETLATVNGNVGTFGDATHVGTFTVNGKGLITAASSTVISAGTGSAAAVVTLAFSSTPTFTCPSATAGTVVDFQAAANAAIVLTGNITSSTLASCTTGSLLNFLFKQDGTGGRTVVMPSGFDTPLVHPAANVTTKLTYYWDGANGRLLTSFSDAGYAACAETGAPGTPPVGVEFESCDSTRLTSVSKDSNGNVHIKPRTLSLTDKLNAQDTTGVEFCTGGGSANAQTATCSPAEQALTTGLTVRWVPSAGNTAGTTLAVDGLTAKSLTKCGTTALASGDLTTAAVATASYDGTQFQLLNPQASTCGGGGGGGGGSMFTTHGTGWYVPVPFSSNTSVNSVANQMRVIQVSFPGGTLGRIAFAIATGQASSNIGAAIYSADCNTLLASSTAGASTASAGGVFPAFSSTYAAVTGTYNIAFSFDTNNVVWYETVAAMALALAEPSFARYNTAANNVSWSGGNPTFPSTCGALTAIGSGTDYPPDIILMP